MAEFEQIKQFKPLRSSGGGSLQVNLTRSKGGVRLDIRTWLSGTSYEGPTQKGISVNLAEVKLLQEQLPDIVKAMEEAEQTK